MFDLDAWQEVWTTLRQNKLRALLTALGVFWGVFMLIVMLGMGNGLERGVARNLGDLVTYSVYIWGQRTSLPYRGLQPGRYVKFTNADSSALQRTNGVEHLAPRLQLGGFRSGQNISYGAKTASYGVTGDSSELVYVEPLRFERGRFINERDMTEERKVVVLGKQLYTELFGAADPLGKYIQIKGVYFQVVGVLVSLKGGDDGDRMNSTAYVPLTTFQGAFNQRDRVGWFALTARRDLPASVVEENVRRTLLDLHHIHPDDSQAIGSFNLADKFERIQKLFGAIRGFIWFVGTLTLLAGVLGVSNILLIIVKERTKEIGIRKALGATPASLIALVLEESLVLTGLSGYAGVAFGVFVLELVGRAVKNLKGAPLSEPAVNLQAALVASFVLIVAGLVAGVVPARHAARIHPVEALRSE